MKNKKLIQSFNNAINGIIYVIKAERNMKIHITAAIIVLVSSLFYELTRLEFLIVCLSIAIVIICELFNTSVEVIVDIITNVYHPKAKIIKDVAAGAVMVSAFISLVVGYFIFFDRISSDLESGIVRIRHSPIHITVIALLVTIIFVLVLKSLFKKGTPFSGGMPSGHAAISSSITTAVALWVDNANIVILCLAMMILIIQSRLEGKIHSIFELLAGTALGFLITLLLFQVLHK